MVRSGRIAGSLLTLPLVVLLLSCSNDTATDPSQSDSEPSAPSQETITTQSPSDDTESVSAEGTSTTQGPIEDPESDSVGVASVTADANFLVSPSEPPDGLAEVLSFGEGGDNPCREEGQPLDEIVALPGFLDVETAEVGWSSILCMGALSSEVPAEGLLDVTVTSPSGVVVTDTQIGENEGDPVAFELPNELGSDQSGKLELYRIAGQIGFEPAIGDELGEYTVSVGLNGQQYERKVDVVPAERERGVLLRGPGVTLRNPQEAVFQITGFDPGESVPVALFGNDPDQYDGSGAAPGYQFFNQVEIEVDDLGQGELRIPISPTDDGCWALVVSPPSQADVEASGSEGGGFLDFGDPHFDTICLNLVNG